MFNKDEKNTFPEIINNFQKLILDGKFNESISYIQNQKDIKRISLEYFPSFTRNSVGKELDNNHYVKMDSTDRLFFYLIMLFFSPRYAKTWKHIFNHYNYEKINGLNLLEQKKCGYMVYIYFLELIKNPKDYDYKILKDFCKANNFWIEAQSANFKEMKITKDNDKKKELIYFFADNIEKLNNEPIYGEFDKKTFIKSVTDYIDVIKNSILDEGLMHKVSAIKYGNEGDLDNAFENMKRAYEAGVSSRTIFEWASENSYLPQLKEYLNTRYKIDPSLKDVYQMINLCDLMLSIQGIEIAELKKYVISFVKRYPNPPGDKELGEFNICLSKYNKQIWGLEIYTILHKTFPGDRYIKKTNADLLIEMENQFDEAVFLYYDAFIQFKNEKKFNLKPFRKVAITCILKDRNDLTQMLLTLLDGENNKLWIRTKKNFNTLIVLGRKINEKNNKSKVNLFNEFCIAVDKGSLTGIIYSICRYDNEFLLNYDEVKEILSNYNQYELKKSLLKFFVEYDLHSELNIESILSLIKTTSFKMYEILKDINDKYRSEVYLLEPYVEKILTNRLTACYGELFPLLEAEERARIKEIVTLLMVELFGFNQLYKYKYPEFIGVLNIPEEKKKEKILELTNTCLKYYNDNPDYFIGYGQMLMKIKHWREALLNFKEANNPKFVEVFDRSDSALVSENICKLYIMAEEGRIDYNIKELSYVLKAISIVVKMDSNHVTLNKLEELFRDKNDPLIHVISSFNYALENKSIEAVREINKVKFFLGELYNSCFNMINSLLIGVENEITEDINSPQEEIASTEEYLIDDYLTTYNDDYDLDKFFALTHDSSMFLSTKDFLNFVPYLALEIENFKLSVDMYEILKLEIKDRYNVNILDELELKSLSNKSLQVIKAAVEKDNIKDFCEFVLKYIEINSIILEKNKLYIPLLHLSFEALLVTYYSSKIGVDWKISFDTAIDNILVAYKSINDSKELFENLKFTKYICTFFKLQENGYLNKIAPYNLDAFKKFVHIWRLKLSYNNIINTVDKRRVIEEIKNEILTIRESFTEIKNNKYRKKYISICDNLDLACIKERERLRKRVNLQCKLLNNMDSLGLETVLHFHVKNTGEAIANELSASIELRKGIELIESKYLNLGGLRKNKGTSFKFDYCFSEAGDYVSIITLKYIEDGEGDYYTCEIPIRIEDRINKFQRTPTYLYLTAPAGAESTYFYGREEEINDIHDNFLDLKRGDHSFFIHGLRRVGKSSLLNYVKTSLNERCYSVLCNADSGILPKTTDELIYKLFVSKIIDSFKYDYGIDLGEVSLEEFSMGSGDSMEKFDAFLRKIEENIGEKSLIILIDEFEGLLRSFNNSVENILPDLRRIALDRLRKTCFIFAGGEDIVNRTEVTVARIADSSRRIRLGFLDKAAAINLIKEPVNEYLVYTDESIESIMQYTKGHPYYIVQICLKILDKLNKEKKENTVYPLDVEFAVQEILKGSDLFINIEEIIVDPCERAIIILLGRFLKHDNDSLDIKKLIEIFKVIDTEYNLEGRFFKDYIKGSADKLVEKNILEKITEKDVASYKFTLELWRLWYKNVSGAKWKEWLEANDIQILCGIDEIEEINRII